MPATLDHQSLVQPSNLKVSLWRYMDLSKFADLLQSRALVFVRSDHLGDPFEGSLPEMNANEFKSIMANRGSLPEAHPFKNMTDAEFEQLSKLTYKKNKNTLQMVYISCWHMNEAESAAMWKLYSKSSDAVCIRTDYETIASVLPSDSYMGVVNYLDYKTAAIQTGNMFYRFMTKRRSFSHEREARAIVMDFGAFGAPSAPWIKKVPVDIATLVKAIYVSPEAPDWFRDVVADLTEKYGLSVHVEKSELNALPLF